MYKHLESTGWSMCATETCLKTERKHAGGIVEFASACIGGDERFDASGLDASVKDNARIVEGVSESRPSRETCAVMEWKLGQVSQPHPEYVQPVEDSDTPAFPNHSANPSKNQTTNEATKGQSANVSTLRFS